MAMLVNREGAVIRCITLNSIVKVWAGGETVKHLRHTLGTGIFYTDHSCPDIDSYQSI